PGQDPVIRVFPAWPKEWDASFQLAARRGFLVTSSIQKGEVEFVELASRLGGVCRLHNPWPDAGADVYKGAKKIGHFTDPVFAITTIKGDCLVLVSSGKSPVQLKRNIP
ncbi:MAG: glycoside hydrolase, partial [Verrucomicrobiota bacterium]